MSSAESFKRYRFSVPNADESVTEWIEAQSNLSFSIRILIRDFIRVHGKVDATCAPVEQRGKVGRPSREEVAAREAARMAAEYVPEPVMPQIQQGYPPMPQQAPVVPPQAAPAQPVFQPQAPVVPQPVAPPVQAPMSSVSQGGESPQVQQFQDPADLIG